MVNQTAYNSLRQHAPRLALALLFQPERQKATLSTLLLLGLEFDRIAAPNPAGVGFYYLDHLTHNVFRGNMDTWFSFYKN